MPTSKITPRLRKLLAILLVYQTIACQQVQPAKQSEDQAPRRIISLSGVVTETISALGLESEIVGVDVTSVYPSSIATKPKVGHIQNLSAEGLLSLNPTMVIGLKDELDRGIGAKLRAAGLNVVGISRENTEEGAKNFIKALGDTLGNPAKAEELITKLKFDLANVKKPDSALRILFVYARGAGHILVGGRNTPADAMIKMCGSINVADEIEGYKPLSPEFVAKANPQVVLTLHSSVQAFGSEEALAKSIGIKFTEAGRRQHIISMDGLKLLGFGPRLGEGLQELSALLAVELKRENLD